MFSGHDALKRSEPEPEKTESYLSQEAVNIPEPTVSAIKMSEMFETPLNALKILLVDCDDQEAASTRSLLNEGVRSNFEILRVVRASDALEHTGESFHIILLAIHPDNVSELDALRHLRHLHSQAAILVLSNIEDQDLALHSMRNGAQDYLVKHHINGRALARSSRYAIERTKAQALVTYHAQHDYLTGLANRRLCSERLENAISHCNRSKTATALLYLDLDRFKAINDTFGHQVGDAVLTTVAARLKTCLRKSDTGVRMGGDEFGILLENVISVHHLHVIVQRILDLIAQPIVIQGRTIHVTASVGIAIYPWDCTETDALLTHSDAAMYRAKARGGNTYELSTSADLPRTAERGASSPSARMPSSIDIEFCRALRKGEFLLHYQPQVNLLTHDIVGMEALLRWHHPMLGMVGPNNFMSQAEDTGMIVPIGEWVLRTATLHATSWAHAGYPQTPVAVNLSAQQLRQTNLAELIERILFAADFPPEYFRIELKEHLLLDESSHAAERLDEIKALGVHVYIDDFGVGPSSLQKLRSFPIDGIKLDRSLIHSLPEDLNNTAIARAVIALANTLGIRVIAEGVETQEHVDLLHRYGCDTIQGFWLTPPVPHRETIHWLRNATPNSVTLPTLAAC